MMMHSDGDREDPVPAYTSGDITIPDDSPIYRPDVIPAFFAAIHSNDVALVTSLLDSNPALVHTPHTEIPGYLPLYAATVAGSTYLVALLAQRGAPIDELSTTGEFYDPYNHRYETPIMRTALMAAASKGSLPLVKLLFNDLRADDSIVAPDGAIALRLAIAAKHPSIIALLPARRAGGWLRFKHSQRKAMRRIRRAGYALYRFGRFFVWDTPKFLLWTFPKYLFWTIPKELLRVLVPQLRRAVKAIPRLPFIIYDLMKRFAKLLKKVILAIPQITVDFFRSMWAFIKAIPEICKSILKACWAVVKAISKWTWKLFTQTIPHLLLSTSVYILQMIKGLGAFLLQFLKDILSFIHTLTMAIITRFKAVTLQDVARAFSFLFISIPKWIWRTTCDAAVAFGNGVVWTLKQMGSFVHCLVSVLWEVVMWIPKMIGQVAFGLAEIVAAGVRETTLYINPKSQV